MKKRSNYTLFVVAVLSENDENDTKKFKWKMHEFMTSHQIFNEYGIDQCDLPRGSRFKHKYFTSEIHENNKKLAAISLSDVNWKKIPIIKSNKCKNRKLDFDDIDLFNQALKTSIDDIRSNNGNLSLISILRIDINEKIICCESLIPIKVPNKSKWIAVSFENDGVNGLYIDCDDIINKAALLDPASIDTYNWLKGQESQDQYDQSLLIETIESLQKSVSDGLIRENMLLSILQQNHQMLQQKEQILQQKQQQIQGIFQNVIIPSTAIPSIYNFNNIQIQNTNQNQYK